MAKIFQPLIMGNFEISNRFVVSPMCQYSAIEGSATNWHLVHLGQFALSNPGLVIVEATAVQPEGRITPGCLGLYSENNETALQPIVDFFKQHSAAKIGIQLAHAGRKGSTQVPWEGRQRLEEGKGWQTVAPSAIPYNEVYPLPMALTLDGLKRIKEDFVKAAKRAVRVGFDVIELHMAHGYLVHQFLSPLSNQRDDQYGGCLENRLRFAFELFQAVRQEVPAAIPMGVRLSASDHVIGGWDISQSIALCQGLEKLGCDFVDVSSGGLSPAQEIDLQLGYQVDFAAKIKAEVSMLVGAVGLIVDAHQAEQIIASNQANMVSLARMMLYNPRFPWHAAEALNALTKAQFPQQYGYALNAQWQQLREIV